MNKEIRIKSNNTPKIVALIILVVLLSIMIWLFNNYGNVLPEGLYKFKIIIIAILAGTILFAFYAIIKQLSSKKPALVINDEGITDNSAFASVGFIPWFDILEIKITSNSLNKKFLTLFLANPDHYIFKCKTNTQTTVLRNYLKTFGTPVIISAVSLKYELGELLEILEMKLTQYKSTQ